VTHYQYLGVGAGSFHEFLFSSRDRLHGVQEVVSLLFVNRCGQIEIRFILPQPAQSWHTKSLLGTSERITTRMPSETVTIAGQPYRTASWRRRIVARAIDLTLVNFVCAIGGASFALLTLPLSVVYLLAGNALLRGQSLGKRLTAIKVIDAKHGSPCRVVQELIRQRYLFFSNPIFLALTAYDSAQGHLDKPEFYVVGTSEFIPEVSEAPREKPAKLDLAGIQATVQRRLDEIKESKSR
jgi:RDD family protein